MPFEITYARKQARVSANAVKAQASSSGGTEFVFAGLALSFPDRLWVWRFISNIYESTAAACANLAEFQARDKKNELAEED